LSRKEAVQFDFGAPSQRFPVTASPTIEGDEEEEEDEYFDDNNNNNDKQLSEQQVEEENITDSSQ
jgi:hypothetical protein